jgi:hypothetical protein
MTGFFEELQKRKAQSRVASSNKADAFLDPLRGNPRFEKLVQKIFGGG